ncbi:hypothetical protein FRC12_006684 [Ceratobasidium sp. 428]|nr:hypothetical protein FRC12_006684 [Ceratobasidium sp. 428]
MDFILKYFRSSRSSSTPGLSSSAASLVRKDTLHSTISTSETLLPQSNGPNQVPVRLKGQYLAKDFGAVSNKYGAIGYGGMTSTI